MATFFAYFDLLGYKKFIENNTDEWLDKRTDHFGRNIEMALALDNGSLPTERPGEIVPNITLSNLNCLTFSDTVVLWSNTATLPEFEEILKVCSRYNHFNVCYDFPSRGRLSYGNLWLKQLDEANQRGGRYMLNMIYGKVLVDAYSKSEAMSFAGCVLDNTAIEHAKTLGNVDALLNEFTMLYDVPYKSQDGEIRVKEYALKLMKGSILISRFIENGIRNAFTQDKKGEIEGRTKVIFDNTIEFLKAQKIKMPYYYYVDDSTDVLAYEVFGRLDDTTITRITRQEKLNKNAIPASYEIENIVWDADTLDRDIFNAKELNPAVFNEQLSIAESVV